MPPRKLRITPGQRLGKRLDRMDAATKALATRMDVLELKFLDVRKELAVAMHSGNYEAMWRFEREENFKLRQNGHPAALNTPVLLRWIATLDDLCWRLDPGRIPPRAQDGVLTPEERRIVDKFSDELRKGKVDLPRYPGDPGPLERAR